jgi:hypothetical protein
MQKCSKCHSEHPDLVCQLEQGHTGCCSCGVDNRLAFPTVHLNGTSRSVLLEQIKNATQALDAALNAMQRAAPHGRDYYPQDREGYRAFDTAARQFRARQEAVRKVRDEYVQIWEKLYADDDR